jgi:hypothetical protein
VKNEIKSKRKRKRKESGPSGNRKQSYHVQILAIHRKIGSAFNKP